MSKIVGGIKIHISKLTIRNFRNFRNATFKFEKGVNTLIGENGSGKTNAFYAIRLLIDDSLPIRASSLDVTDFIRGLGDWRGHWIVLVLEFEELDSSEATQVLTNHGIGHMDDVGRGTYALYFRPQKAIRKKLFDLSQREDKNDQDLSDLLSEITIDNYETVFHCRVNADFSEDEIYKKYVGDFKKIVFPDPETQSAHEIGVKTPPVLSIAKELSCTFVKALRDVVSELKNVRYNPLLKLMQGRSKDIEAQKANDITTRVTELNKAIGELDEVQVVSKGIKNTLANTVGTTYAPMIDIKSELPDDMEKLLQSLTLWVGDPNDGAYQGQVSELSLGGANLIYLSLKLLEYEIKQSTDKVAHFLLIEV